MTTILNIEGREVGPGRPCFIVAEGCDNHMGSLETAKEMARQAKLAGADAIKFQHHIVDEEMLREGVPMSSNFNIPLDQFLDLYALSLEQHAELRAYCAQIGIIYLCTPFSLKAAQELHELGVNAFKIGSGELTDLPTLKRIAAFQKPMILSTGMAEWEEIDLTVNTLRPINDQIALLNCTSAYPTKHEDVQLRVIDQLRTRYDVVVGHSDHTPDIHTSIAAATLGASILEKHFILDRRVPGPDQSVSIEPAELYELVTAVRRIEAALGSDKRVRGAERPIRAWAHRSVVTLRPIAAGTVLTEEHVWTKRPGTGIPARELDKVLGRKVKTDLPKDRLLTWDDLEE